MFKNKKTFALILIILIISLFSAGFIFYYFKNKSVKNDSDKLFTEELKNESTKKSIPDNQKKSSKKTQNPVEIKNKINFSVPFTSQAPYANWDEFHNEACEEAAVLMVYQYFEGDRRLNIPVAEADQEIIKMVNWQIKKLGIHKDLTAFETVQYLAKNYLGLKNARVKSDFSTENIKKELNSGRVVIVPCAGRLLGNPNFKRPGPVYHMVVIRGYDGKYFITNDPGTRKGKEYKYTYQVVENAVHDWAGLEGNILKGKKVYITLY